MEMEKLMERKRTEQQRERIICSSYYTFTEPAPPTISLTKEITTKGNTNLDFLPSAMFAAPYQRKSASNRSYHQKSHTGARRRGHEAQSVSDNGAEGAWPASSRVRVQVGDKELKGGEGLREEETAGTCATSCSEFPRGRDQTSNVLLKI